MVPVSSPAATVATGPAAVPAAEVPPRMRRLGVIGAGTMGAGIAALAASAGLPVELLDVGGDEPPDGPARAGLERALRARPPAFMHPSCAALVRTGSVDHHLERLAGCDWVVEAIVERADAKRALYARVEEVVRSDAVISSNTSGIPMATLVEGRSDAFRRRFLGTHFFNPPRHLRLLELIPGTGTDPAVVAWVREVAERLLGKGVVVARDTPGFIASRVGMHATVRAIRLMEELGLGLDEVDALTGELIGRPRSATFRTADLVGLDVLAAVAAQIADATGDDLALPAWLHRLVDEGRIGEKAGEGLYARRDGDVLVLDPATGTYRPRRPDPPELAALRRRPLDERLAGARALPGPHGELVRRLLEDTAAAGRELADEIADDPADVDRAMEWGWGWERGPLGTDPHSAPAPPAVFRLADVRAAGGVLWERPDAALLDLGEGVAGIEIRTTMNAIGAGVHDAFADALDQVESEGWRGLVIGGEHPRAFSAGADLKAVAALAEAGDWDALDAFVRRAQALDLAVARAPFPVVAAAAGLALGGGAELAMHADRVQAHAELAIGLVEARVGLIPAGGGVALLLARFSRDLAPYAGADLVEAPRRAFELIVPARTSESALDARALGLIGREDRITMSRPHLLADARARVLDLAPGYVAPAPAPIPLLGGAALGNLRYAIVEWREAGRLSPHDARVAEELALVLSGGDGPMRHASEEDVLDREREAFLRLLGTAATRERIAHTLATGTPLRN